MAAFGGESPVGEKELNVRCAGRMAARKRTYDGKREEECGDEGG
jgi:hypothetical protein